MSASVNLGVRRSKFKARKFWRRSYASAGASSIGASQGAVRSAVVSSCRADPGPSQGMMRLLVPRHEQHRSIGYRYQLDRDLGANESI